MNPAEDLKISKVSKDADKRMDDRQVEEVRGGFRTLLFLVIGAAFVSGCKTKLDRRLEMSRPLEEIKAEILAMQHLREKEVSINDVKKAVKPTKGIVLTSKNMTIRDEDIFNIMNRRFPEGWDQDALETKTTVVDGKKTTEILYKGNCIILISKTRNKLITLRVFDNEILFGETENIVFNPTTEQIEHQSACIRDPLDGRLCYSEHNFSDGVQKTTTYMVKLPVLSYGFEDHCVKEDEGELKSCPGF